MSSNSSSRFVYSYFAYLFEYCTGLGTLLIFLVEQGRATQAAQDSFLHIRDQVVFLFRRGARKTKELVDFSVAIVAQASFIQA